MRLCNLHCHSHYSLLDGKSSIDDMIKRAKDLGHTAVGIMDHGNCFGHVEFNLGCRKNGLNPIMGCEFYHIDEIEKEGEKKERAGAHISVIAMNNVGLRSLNKLTLLGARQYYYKPRITTQNIIDNNEGLILLSGCFGGIISQALLHDNDEAAILLIKKFRDVFGDRFYLELQNSGVEGQPKIVGKLRELSKRFGIKAVVTNDSHYVKEEDSYYHSILLAMNTGSKMSDASIENGGKRFAFGTNEYWMKDQDTLLKEGWTQQEIEESQNIADRCDVTIDTSIKMPTYPFIPEGHTSFSYLKELLRDGWFERGLHQDKEHDYNGRMQHELSDIEGGNLSDYFLITWHYVNEAIKKKIGVGDGRGSAAGSLVSYILGITNINPMKYGLYWERFWNAGRAGVGLPDIDCDFSQERRGEVIRLVEKTFGKEYALPIITYGKMKIRGAIKDVARCLGINVDIVNEITDCVSAKAHSFDEAYGMSEELVKWKEKYKLLFEAAEQLSNTPRHTSIHASAILILNESIESGCIPVMWDTTGKQIVTGYDYHALDKMNYVKADCLGLRTIDILDRAVKLINR